MRAWYGHTTLGGIGTWADPDVHHLAALMRRIASGGDDVRRSAMRHAENVRRLYPAHTLIDGVWRIWNETAAATRAATP